MATSTKSKSVSSLNKTLKQTINKAKGLGIDTSKAESVSKQTDRQGGTAYKGSTEDVNYQASQKGVINVDTLGKGAPILNLPEKPVPTGFDSAMPFSVTNDSLDASNARQNQLDAGYLQNQIDLKPPSLTDEYAKAEKEAGIKKLENTVSSYDAQLKEIGAQRDAQVLSLEGQGRGQTQGFIGGEQARINREATIRALPIQAQADIAQGNLDRANSRLDKLFSIYQQDVQNQFQYKSKVVEATYSILSGAEQRRATQLLAIQKEKADTKKSNIDYLRQLSAEARDNGNSNALSMLSTIDPNSDNFESEVARASQMIRKPQVASKRDTQVVNGQLVDMQTGEVISNIGGNIQKPQTQAQTVAQGYADRAREADAIVTTYGNQFTGLTSYLGQSLPNFFKSSERQQYEQAQRNFVNAILRPESGAVISDTEFDNAKKQYFPQPGDGEAVIAQKAQNRQTKINNLYQTANTAQPVSAGSIIEDGQGNRYKVEADGVTLTPV